jgi:hypothetical protein
MLIKQSNETLMMRDIAGFSICNKLPVQKNHKLKNLVETSLAFHYYWKTIKAYLKTLFVGRRFVSLRGQRTAGQRSIRSSLCLSFYSLSLSPLFALESRRTRTPRWAMTKSRQLHAVAQFNLGTFRSLAYGTRHKGTPPHV